MSNQTGAASFKLLFIYYWYNDITRLFLLSGIPYLLLFFLLSYFLGQDIAGNIIVVFYAVTLLLLLVFNDYSNLRKIGMDEYRRPLK